MGASWGTAIAVYVVNTVAYFAYTIIGHARWGQTIGKHVARIRVRDLAGHPITWIHAWRRSSVDIALGTTSLIIYAIVLARIPATDFDALSWGQISERYNAMRPWWDPAIGYLYFAWLGSEVVSVLFNRRRRALHASWPVPSWSGKASRDCGRARRGFSAWVASRAERGRLDHGWHRTRGMRVVFVGGARGATRG